MRDVRTMANGLRTQPNSSNRIKLMLPVQSPEAIAADYPVFRIDPIYRGKLTVAGCPVWVVNRVAPTAHR